eukprot:14647230-Alexandrium_andersonii.AAC.1
MPLLRGAAPREHPGEGSPQLAVLGTAQEAAIRRRCLGEESRPDQGSGSSSTAGEGVRGVPPSQARGRAQGQPGPGGGGHGR